MRYPPEPAHGAGGVEISPVSKRGRLTDRFYKCGSKITSWKALAINREPAQEQATKMWRLRIARLPLFIEMTYFSPLPIKKNKSDDVGRTRSLSAISGDLPPISEPFIPAGKVQFPVESINVID